VRSGLQFCLTPDFERQAWLGIALRHWGRPGPFGSPILAPYFAQPKLTVIHEMNHRTDEDGHPASPYAG
jgi:hypothetical protein